LSYARITGQRTHVTRTENVAHQTISFVHAEGIAMAGCNTGGILTAVLQQQQRIIDELVHWAMRNDANNATHGGAPSKNMTSGQAGNST
jgi:hypothetical protein